MGHRLFITGAAGYIGAMLCDQFSRRPDVELIVGLDKAPMPGMLHGRANIRWVQAETADASWAETVAGECPDLVIHTAWQIRDIYGRPDLQHRLNVAGTGKVFAFAFDTSSVKRLVHFSTVAAYGLQDDNTIERRFTEADPLRRSNFRYAEEKRTVETQLEAAYAQARRAGREIAVTVLRPAAVTGPRGRSRGSLIGLQAALTGNLKGNAIGRLVALLMTYLPVTETWCRQFVHEDDLIEIVTRLSFGDAIAPYAVFNVCPPGPVVCGEDIAAAFGKRLFRVHPQLIRLAFFLAWHASRGRIPTSRGTWKSYSYALAVDGAKLSAALAYEYRMDSLAAFTQNIGLYAS